jgi:hypothetical protein
MDLDPIVRSLDAAIRGLEKIRALLTGHAAPLKRGMRSSEPARKRSTKRTEGRARIAAAQKKRWSKAKRK